MTITYEQFCREVVNFRSIMCDARHWLHNEPDAILNKCFGTLIFTMSGEVQDHRHEVEVVCQATTEEFIRRANLIAMRKAL